MKEFIKYSLLVINTLSFVCLAIVAVFIFYCEFFGYNKGNDFLKKINFPLDDNGIIIVGFICLAIMILSYFVRKKFFN